ncbi:hypothetical protein GCM10010510_69440 [Streptomyces anandii JCM 4720]|nr:hypothetical protein GCM10010510_69440 [Streptomyces anandii JCM 4720]
MLNKHIDVREDTGGVVGPAAREALERVADQFSASLGVWVWRQRRERFPSSGKNR